MAFKIGNSVVRSKLVVLLLFAHCLLLLPLFVFFVLVGSCFASQYLSQVKRHLYCHVAVIVFASSSQCRWLVCSL